MRKAADKVAAKPQGPAYARAKAQLTAVKRDPAKRRYRHHWERAIRALVGAARGKDAAPALLDAARASYVLYRFSAAEPDREQALRLAGRASAAGSREAPAFAAAIRREAGDEPARAPLAKGKRSRARAPTATAPPAPSLDDESEDPVLETALAEVMAPAEVPVVPAGPEPSEPPAGPAHVSEVRTWSNADYTRVAVYLSRAVEWSKEELAADGGHPRRLALDLAPAVLDGKALARPVGDAQVERVRAAQRDAETVRVVLDLPGRHGYQLFSLDDPPRLIVDVGTHDARRDALASRLEPREPPPAAADEPGAGGEASEGALSRSIRRVVVDAGHGGHDAGAIGPLRVREKDVTLAMALRLARKLRAAGFEVVLTRKDDRYLRLEERTAIANTARGDLFVSLHANAHRRRDRKGVETYFLNVTDDRYAARLAARENGALSDGGEYGPIVQRIRTDLDATASAGASRHLAQMVQREICDRVRSHVGDVRDLGVKNALFYVLLGARMPAVLVETAFVSNRDEERRLASSRYQEEVAEGVARAVAAFAARQGGPRLAAR